MKIQGGRVGLTWALGLIVSVVIAAPSELDHQEGVDVAILTPPELDHQEDVDVAIMTPPELDHQEDVDVAIMTPPELDHQEDVDVAIMTPPELDHQEDVDLAIMTPSELDHQEGVDVAIMTLSELDHQEGVDVALMTPSEPDYQEGVGVSIMTPSELDHQEGVGSHQQENVTALPTTERNDKLLVVLLKIQPDMCATNDPVLAMGTCVPAKECTKTSGIASGKCAKGYGVCCIALRSCGSSTSYNNTYFVNPSYSGMDSGAGTCTLTVNRVNSNICQLRLDFLDFDLAQPDADGNCITDFLTITPSSSVPRICGSNDGQHMYVNVDPAGGPIRVTVDRSLSNVTRSWNIKVSQIPCDSPYKGEDGNKRLTFLHMHSPLNKSS
ncbi:uncharacterized protein, partial [Cherax quadricarinatus]|uniref:uncharacterized protein n=1 Tax=Cherax quadricarinatus TaxID=27406 RepID=UPI00387E61E4